MDRFNINDIENLTGIKAHTLRIWEKRYNFSTPKRKESNHRYYDNNDLKHILKVAHLYRNGYKISKIAALKREDINNLVLQTASNGHAEELFADRLLQHGFEFNLEGFEDTLNHAIQIFGFEKCIIKVVFPYFEKVGMLWMNDIAVPAQEHFSSSIIRNKIILAIEKLKAVNPGHTPILLFTPQDEYHELPLLFISYLFKKYGKSFIYYGVNTSIKELESFSNCAKFDTLYFHLITNFTKQSLDDYLTLLCCTFPQKQIVMSGPLACKSLVKAANCLLLASQGQALNFVKEGLAEKYL